MTDKTAEFNSAFDAYMRGGDGAQFERFVDSLSFADCERCIHLYLILYQGYDTQSPKSRGAFASLVKRALTRGEVREAVRIDALNHAKTAPWGQRFAALSPSAIKSLEGQAKRRKAQLPPEQQKFLKLFRAAVENQDDRPLEQHVSKLSFAEAHGRLLLYLEASQRYPDDNAASVQMFYGIATIVLGQSESKFAEDFLRLIHEPNTIWGRRWTAVKPEDRRRELEAQARAVPAKQRMIEVGKREGTVPSPVYTPPASTTDGRVAGRAAPTTAQQRKFVELFRRYVASKRQGPELQAFADWLEKRTVPELRECLTAYLTAPLDYPGDNAESLDTFFRIALALLERGDAYDAGKLDMLIQPSARTAALRFKALKPERQQTLSEKIAAQRKDARFLVGMKLDYFRRHNRDPDMAALWKYEPPIDNESRAALRSAIQACDRSYEQGDVKRFVERFDAFSQRLLDEKNETALLAALKICRDAADVGALLRSELYWCAVLALFRRLLAGPRPERYSDGFEDEETKFLIDAPLRAQAYLSDFKVRLACAIEAHMGPSDMQDLVRAHAVLLLLGRRMGRAILLTMEETAGIKAKLDQLAKEKNVPASRVSFTVQSKYLHELKVGEWIGSASIAWWEQGTAYLEFWGAEGVLYRVDYDTLGKICDDDATYGAIWRDNQHLLTVIPFFFEVMGYVVDLTTGGLGELAKGIVVDIIVDEVAQHADLGAGATIGLSLVGNVGADMLTDAARGMRTPDVFPGIDDTTRGIARQEGAVVEASQRAISPVARAAQPDAPAFTPQVSAAAVATPEPPRKAIAAAGAGGDGGTPPRVDADAPAPSPRRKKAASPEAPEASASVRGEPKRVARFIDEPAVSGRAISPKAPDSPDAGPAGKPFYNVVIDINHPALVALQNAGFTIKFIPAKHPKTGAGRFHKFLGGVDVELQVISPSGLRVEIDIPAIDPMHPGRLLFVEVKATFVANPIESAHLVFNAAKAVQLARHTAVAMETNGWVTRIEVATNAPRVHTPAGVPGGESFTHLGDVYMSNIVQGVTTELMARFRKQVLDYIERTTGKRLKKLDRRRVQKIVEEMMGVTSLDWGYVRKRKPKKPKAKKKRPPRKPRKPPTKPKSPPKRPKPPTKA